MFFEYEDEDDDEDDSSDRAAAPLEPFFSGINPQGFSTTPIPIATPIPTGIRHNENCWAAHRRS
jgi:hypothetical protein